MIWLIDFFKLLTNLSLTASIVRGLLIALFIGIIESAILHAPVLSFYSLLSMLLIIIFFEIHIFIHHFKSKEKVIYSQPTAQVKVSIPFSQALLQAIGKLVFLDYDKMSSIKKRLGNIKFFILLGSTDFNDFFVKKCGFSTSQLQSYKLELLFSELESTDIAIIQQSTTQEVFIDQTYNQLSKFLKQYNNKSNIDLIINIPIEYLLDLSEQNVLQIDIIKQQVQKIYTHLEQRKIKYCIHFCIVSCDQLLGSNKYLFNININLNNNHAVGDLKQVAQQHLHALVSNSLKPEDVNNNYAAVYYCQFNLNKAVNNFVDFFGGLLLNKKELLHFIGNRENCLYFINNYLLKNNLCVNKSLANLSKYFDCLKQKSKIIAVTTTSIMFVLCISLSNRYLNNLKVAIFNLEKYLHANLEIKNKSFIKDHGTLINHLIKSKVAITACNLKSINQRIERLIATNIPDKPIKILPYDNQLNTSEHIYHTWLQKHINKRVCVPEKLLDSNNLTTKDLCMPWIFTKAGDLFSSIEIYKYLNKNSIYGEVNNKERLLSEINFLYLKDVDKHSEKLINSISPVSSKLTLEEIINGLNIILNNRLLVDWLMTNINLTDNINRNVFYKLQNYFFKGSSNYYSKIQKIQKEVEALHEKITNIYFHRNNYELFLNDIISLFNQEDNYLERLKFSTKNLPKPINKIYGNIIYSIERSIFNEMAKTINLLWQKEVISKYQLMKPCFPFNPSSHIELDITNFISFFDENGIINGFITKYVAPLSVLNNISAGIKTTKDYTYFINDIKSIQTNFGLNDVTKVNLKVTPTYLSPNIIKAELNIFNQSIIYKHGLRYSTNININKENLNSTNTKIIFTSLINNDQTSIENDGDWSWYKFLKLNDLNNNIRHTEISFSCGGKEAIYKLEWPLRWVTLSKLVFPEQIVKAE